MGEKNGYGDVVLAQEFQETVLAMGEDVSERFDGMAGKKGGGGRIEGK